MLPSPPRVEPIEQLRERPTGFTHPLLECDTVEEKDPPELAALHARVVSTVDAVKQKGLASDVAVYYRDLDRGSWLGVHEEERFSPASLLKIATLITILRNLETTPGLLDKTVVSTAPQEAPLPQMVDPPPPLEVGRAYSIGELVERMIVDSDNAATDLLQRSLAESDVKQTFTDLGVAYPGPKPSEDFMSPREFSTFFRVLYNAAYLGPTISETTLQLLSKVRFDKGLRAAIPAKVAVAHKFGERAYRPGGADARYQLHDCGIVYEPGHPFFLCVMTRGESYDHLATAIREVTAGVYEEIKRSK